MKHTFSLLALITILFNPACKKSSDSNSDPAPVPVANYTYAGAGKHAPDTVTFTNTSTNATSYSWDFGDNGTSSNASPTHVFLSGGVFTVKLTATGTGGSNSTSKTINILDSADNTPPVVTLSGNSNMAISLNASGVSDPGATAMDDVDGALAVTSDWSSTNPDLNLTGTYTIHYTATDHAGNTGSATRTVMVKNDAEYLAGNYLTTEDVTTWPQVITVSHTINNRIIFSKFADYNNNNSIYAQVSGTNVFITTQTAAGIGIYACTHVFSPNGSGNPITLVSGKYNFSVKFTDEELNSGINCPAVSPLPYEDFFVQQ